MYRIGRKRGGVCVSPSLTLSLSHRVVCVGFLYLSKLPGPMASRPQVMAQGTWQLDVCSEGVSMQGRRCGRGLVARRLIANTPAAIAPANTTPPPPSLAKDTSLLSRTVCSSTSSLHVCAEIDIRQHVLHSRLPNSSSRVAHQHACLLPLDLICPLLVSWSSRLSNILSPPPPPSQQLPPPHQREPKYAWAKGNRIGGRARERRENSPFPMFTYSSISASSSPILTFFLLPPPVSCWRATLLTWPPTLRCIFSISSSASTDSASA